MWVVDVPLELVTKDYVTYSYIELNDFNQLSLHLLVLPKSLNLFFHTVHDFMLADSR